MDYIFGTLATDELKLIQHRASRHGIQHGHRIEPPDPMPGDPVMLILEIGPDINAEHVVCYFTLDGTEPLGERGVASNGATVRLEQVETTWDTMAWGYRTIWQGILPAQAEGTLVRYRIGAWADDGTPEIFADSPDVKATIERATSAFFKNQPLPTIFVQSDVAGQTFAYSVDRLSPPRWAREAVIYHIFVDRFYPGEDRQWLSPDDLKGFYGGTLWGVRGKLDYIVELGATCIWLSPTFVSPTYHGYDVADYFHVEPRLGGDDALRALVAAAHARGLRILLDLACNHISNQNPVFQTARRDPASPQRQWFTFDDSKIGYRTYFGVPSMPEVNIDHPGARAWLIDVARYWLREFDIDGFRLDHANGPGPGFWSEFWTACKEVKPDCFCFGEVIESPDILRAYAGRMDGILDFIASETLRKTYGYQTMNAVSLERFMTRQTGFFDPNLLLPTFLDNHDMDRFLFIAGNDKEALMRAAAAQMQLPGPPIIYYGTEVGLSQRLSKADGDGDKQARLPMLWGKDQDTRLLEYYKGLIRQRRSDHTRTVAV